MANALHTFIRRCHIAKVKLIRLISKKRREARPGTVEDKWALLEEANRAGIRTFIETGTYRGDMVEHFKGKFTHIYSIEIGSELATYAQKRFLSYPSIEIIEGDSSEILPRLLAKLEESAVFLLDAHCSEGDTFRGADYTPIASELRSILSHPLRHTIIVDDARLFDGIDYPTLRKIRRLVRRTKPTASMEIVGDLIRIRT